MNAPLAVPKTLQKRLEKIAAASRRKPEALLKAAIQDQLDYEEWVIREIKAGLAELDYDNIIRHDNLKRALEKDSAERAKKRRQAAGMGGGARSHLIEIETYIEAESPAASHSEIDHILISVNNGRGSHLLEKSADNMVFVNWC